MSHTMITKSERSEKATAFNNLIKKIGADIFCFCEYAPYFSLQSDGTEDKQDLTRHIVFGDYVYFEYNERSYKNCNGMASMMIPFQNVTTVDYSKWEGKRNYIVSDIIYNKENIKIVETHLDTNKYPHKRDRQIIELIESFKDEEYVILCGDFNILDVKMYNLFTNEGFSMANHGIFGDLITYLSNKNSGWMLDNIIYKGFELLGVQVYNTHLSDHFAISCDLKIKK